MLIDESRNFLLVIPSNLSCPNMDHGGNMQTLDQLDSLSFICVDVDWLVCRQWESESQTTHKNYG